MSYASVNPMPSAPNPMRPQLRSMKRILMIILSIVVAAAAYTAVIRPSNAQELCSAVPEKSDGQMNLDIPAPASDAEFAVWNGAPAPPAGLTSDSAGGIRLYGTLERCAADNALPEWAQGVISWAIYVGVGLVVARTMVAGCALLAEDPPAAALCLTRVAGVSGGIAGAASAYFAEGMKSGNWGWPALKEAIKAGLASAGLSAAIGIAFTNIPTTVGDLLISLKNKIAGIGWWLWMAGADALRFLAQYARPVEEAIAGAAQEMGVIPA